ncbi:MAG: phosphate transport system regulatory protein PhoU [Desulfobacteraceae bacterium 4484_190.2]|nr:MAG: phosphate transport system regulatory protein PhoU [Desulfobacteraceae bacterium 4484_190.2]
MPVRLQKELQKLKKRILSLGAMVEERVRMAIKAVETRDEKLAKRIIEMDREIDENEVEVEEECLKILALHQPVAVDLRFITAVIKINNYLERIGDQAVNISQRVVSISRRPPVTVPFEYKLMAEKTETMLRESLDALVNLDEDLAHKVCLKDDEIDDMNREIYDEVKEVISSHPGRVGYMINLLLVSRHLERIADLTTNIAEEVIYMVEGEISRHRMNESFSIS